ncbi:MAG: T9SS type A sorting domain-containing protein [Bacteroidales bacterium]|nr:T9SS type A sorting domain-containing protein [Bacteroidales bacterium]
MRKHLLILAAVCLAIGVSAQKLVQLPTRLQQKAAERIYSPASAGDPAPVNGFNPYTSAPLMHSESGKMLALEEEQIGTTWWDLQTNSITQNRMHMFDDGTMSAIWIYGDTPQNFPERGTAYNYYDGSAWGPYPIARMEGDRTGWPSVASWGEDGEIICSHISGGVNQGLLFNRRPTKGTGAWEEILYAGPTGSPLIYWPRMVTTGTGYQTVHLIVLTAPTGNGGNVYQGQDGALLYSRSSDGGATWEFEHQLFDELNSNHYTAIRGDNYMWADPRAGVLAFMIADPWMDLVVMKSLDNGDTWTKTVVWEHPYPFFDWNSTITTDTIWCPDNSGGMSIDNGGMVHIVFGLSRVAHTEVGNTYSYWPYTDGIVYWNETMPPFEAANQHRALAYENLTEDVNYIGWTQDVNNNGIIDFLTDLFAYRELGISTMPDIAIDANNIIYLTFASTTETYDNGTYNYKHIWVRSSPDGGTTWGNFYDLNTDLVHIFDECIFPHVAYYCDEWVYFHYNIDATPGIAWSGDHSYQENKTIFAKYTDIVNIGEKTGISFRVSQNTPNPFAGESIVQVVLDRKAEVRMEVFDLTGQKVLEINRGLLNTGTHQLRIDGSRLGAGLYFYTVTAGDQAMTRKMIVGK